MCSQQLFLSNLQVQQLMMSSGCIILAEASIVSIDVCMYVYASPVWTSEQIMTHKHEIESNKMKTEPNLNRTFLSSLWLTKSDENLYLCKGNHLWSDDLKEGKRESVCVCIAHCAITRPWSAVNSIDMWINVIYECTSQTDRVREREREWATPT